MKRWYRVVDILLLVVLVGLACPACGGSAIEIYNPAGVREDGAFVDELLKQAMDEAGKSRPPKAADFPKADTEKVQTREDAFDEINGLFYQRGWTDGMPIIPPTTDRVNAMLQGTDLPPSHVVGVVDPMKGQATVQKIAANAVMAGCRPEYMPVLIAAVKAISDPDFGLVGLGTTTNPDTTMIFVSGPILKHLDFNTGTNALGRGWRSNATIGRALHLIINNVGGSWPGVNDMSCLGTPGDYSMVLAENREASPWEPLQVELGHPADASVVVALGAEGTHALLGIGLNSEQFLRMVADHLAGLERPRRSAVLLIIATDTAAMLARDGWTKSKMKEFISDRGRIPYSEYKERFIDTNRAREAPEWIQENKDPNAMIPVPIIDQLLIVVAGGPGEKSMLIPCWGGSKVVSEEIQLPPNWASLLAAAAE